MAGQDNLGSFIKENKSLVKDYLDTRLEIYKLKMIRLFSKSVGYFIWMIISVFLVFLFIVFAGLVTGFWLSSLTGSYVAGFGYTTLIMLVLIVVLAVFRKALFVNPIIRKAINGMTAVTRENTPGEN